MPLGKIILRDFKGVNLLQSRRLIADEELRWARNVYPSDKGFIESRPRMHAIIQGKALHPPNYADLGLYGEPYCKFFEFLDENAKQRTVFVGWINTTNQMLPHYKIALAIVEWDPLLGFSTVVHHYESKATRVGGPYTWPISGFVFESALYIVAGHDPGVPILKVTGRYLDDQEVQSENVVGTWANSQGVGISPTICAMWGGSLVVAGLPGADAGTIFITDPLNKTVDGTSEGMRRLTGHSLVVGVDDADPIIAMVEVPVWGGAKAVEPYLLVLKRSSIWAIYGTVPVSTDSEIPADVRIVPLMYNEGCISPNTVALTPFGVVWCSGKNVWILPGAGGPSPIGNKISPHLATLPQGPGAGWAAIYDAVSRRYMLGVPNPGNNTWGDSVQIASEQWWADMRENPEEPQWWGPQDIPALGFFYSVAAGGLIVGVCPVQWTVPPLAGISLSSIGSFRNDLLSFKTFTLDEQSLDFKDMMKAEYTTQWDVRFKEFDFGDPFLLKIFDAIEIEASLSIEWEALHADATPCSVEFQVGNTPTQPIINAADDGQFRIDSDNNPVKLDNGGVFTDDGFAGFIGQPGYGVSSAYPNHASGRLVGRTLTPRLRSNEVLHTDGQTVRSHLKLATMGLIMRVLGRRPTSKGQVDS